MAREQVKEYAKAIYYQFTKLLSLYMAVVYYTFFDI